MKRDWFGILVVVLEAAVILFAAVLIYAAYHSN